MQNKKTVLYLIALSFIVALLVTNCKKNNLRNEESFSLENLLKTSQLKEDDLISMVVHSSEFSLNPLVTGKIVDLTKSSVSYNEGDKGKPVVTIVLLNENEVVGSVEAIPIKDENFKLPNDAKYFMLYRDFTEFDSSLLSGNINFYDMNYDNHHIGEIIYDKKIATKVKIQGLTAEIKFKYNKIIHSNSLYLKSKSSTKMAIASSEYNGLCDGNGNGNLSFAECFSCFNQSCATMPECFTLCFGIGDTFSWVVLGMPYCQAAITASCVYLSSIY